MSGTHCGVNANTTFAPHHPSGHLVRPDNRRTSWPALAMSPPSPPPRPSPVAAAAAGARAAGPAARVAPAAESPGDRPPVVRPRPDAGPRRCGLSRRRRRTGRPPPDGGPPVLAGSQAGPVAAAGRAGGRGAASCLPGGVGLVVPGPRRRRARPPGARPLVAISIAFVVLNVVSGGLSYADDYLAACVGGAFFAGWAAACSPTCTSCRCPPWTAAGSGTWSPG